MSYRKKLIEVALPLEAINKASAREKSIRHGHPSTLHLWWARRPLAACRAVLFASLVDDPSSHPEKFTTEEEQERERQRLFKIIEELVLWESTNNERVLNAAREEILKSTDGNPPSVLDPFCGGGSIPLEAQRLGLKAYASDLNPVAVLITKALIEMPPKFAGKPPVNAKSREGSAYSGTWVGAAGLADDVRYYGQWMRDEAEKRIGHLYPKGLNGETVIAWLWARTVKCPNPACGAQMPLVRSFWLSKKKNKKAWVEPGVDKKSKTVQFEVKTGEGMPPEGTVNRRGARCIVCDTPVPFPYVRAEGQQGRMGAELMAIVTEGSKGRAYAPPNPEQARIASTAKPEWVPDSDLPQKALGFRVQQYGMTRHADLFTPRQLVALTTFSDLVAEAREKVLADLGTRASRPQDAAKMAALPGDDVPLNDGGTGATAYADAVATYLAFAVDKVSDRNSTICSWDVTRDNVRNTFARQAIPMTWDFAEANPFSDSTGNFRSAVEWGAKVVECLPCGHDGVVKQLDATAAIDGVEQPVVCTDPPYYDNVGYADLSDFFYVWLRRSIGKVHPDVFSTLLVPKTQELVATPYRFDGDKDKAKRFFEEGLGMAFAKAHEAQHSDYPLTVFYAFKQSESAEDGANGSPVASTGWETMLQGLLQAGFHIDGTWPMRTELSNRPVASGTNALASSIVLVCRKRSEEVPMATRREFVAALRKELPDALHNLTHGGIAPVDLAQASIGPGMAVFSRYSKVLEADGSPMPVRTALQIINQELDTYLAEQEGDLDRDTQFCIAWFEQYGMEEDVFGQADVLARAKDTAVEGLVEAGVLHARAGKVRILKRSELPDDWNPAEDARLTVWECAQHLIRNLEKDGEEGAAQLCARLGGGQSEGARALAYRLYSICDRKGWTEEALAYNTLVTSWPAIQEKVAHRAAVGEQTELL